MVNKRYGLPFRTYTGKIIYPLDLTPEDICIEDIAHALSCINRFGGHALVPYNVADHSIRVSRYCKKSEALQALLHDSSEAYLVDIPRPIKLFLPEYKAFEEKAQKIICEKFDIEYPFSVSVHRADARILATEKRDLFKQGYNLPDEQVIKPYKEGIIPLTQKQSEKQFLLRYEELNGKRNRN